MEIMDGFVSKVPLLDRHGATLVRPHNAEIEYLNISDCKDSTIYVTARIRFCLITGCENTTIILGGVSTICTTHNCEKVSIHVAAHCYKMENCIDTSAFLYCHLPPIITGDTRGIKLAPYNVLHSHMASVLHGSQMTLDREFVDIWAHPICCTAGMAGETLTRTTREALFEEQNTTYHFVHPSKFFPVVVPETGPRGVAPQLVLPEVYDKAMKERQEEIRELMSQMRNLSSESAQRKAQDRLQSCFKDSCPSSAGCVKTVKTKHPNNGSDELFLSFYSLRLSLNPRYALLFFMWFTGGCWEENISNTP